MSTAVAKQEKRELTPAQKACKTIVQHKDSLLECVPRGVDGEHCIRLFIQQLRSNAALANCSPQSLLNAVVDAVQSGLSLGGPQQHCAIVPYKRDAQFQIMYKGWLELSRRTGQMVEHNHGVVREGDHFEYALGDAPFINHKPSVAADRNKRPITHVYVSFKLANGGTVREIWTTEQIDDHKKKYSRAWDKSDSAWKTAWEQMALKTLVLQCFHRGRMPVSESMRELVARQQMMSVGEQPPTTKIDTMWEALTHQPEASAQSPAEEPVAEQEANPPEEMSDDERFAELTLELADAKNLGSVTAIQEKYLSLSSDEAYTTDVELLCQERADAIRAARSSSK